MKKILLLILTVILLSGCQKNENYELIIDTSLCYNCYKKVYEFKDGTTVYSSCPNITYKTDDTEISIQEALDKKFLTLSDLEEVKGLKIYKSNENKPVSCSD